MGDYCSFGLSKIFHLSISHLVTVYHDFALYSNDEIDHIRSFHSTVKASLNKRIVCSSIQFHFNWTRRRKKTTHPPPPWCEILWCTSLSFGLAGLFFSTSQNLINPEPNLSPYNLAIRASFWTSLYLGRTQLRHWLCQLQVCIAEDLTFLRLHRSDWLSCQTWRYVQELLFFRGV
jgi:hypothetical protein